MLLKSDPDVIEVNADLGFPLKHDSPYKTVGFVTLPCHCCLTVIDLVLITLLSRIRVSILLFFLTHFSHRYYYYLLT